MKFYTKIEELPENADAFFSVLGFSKASSPVTTQDLKDRLIELRLAYKKYPEHKKRIIDMTLPLKVGIRKYEQIISKS